MGLFFLDFLLSLFAVAHTDEEGVLQDCVSMLQLYVLHTGPVIHAFCIVDGSSEPQEPSIFSCMILFFVSTVHFSVFHVMLAFYLIFFPVPLFGTFFRKE